MQNNTKAILAYLSNDLKKNIDVHYAQDCCIAASRIVLDVLEHFEIPARELVTQLIVYNSAYREYVELNQRFPTQEELIDGVHNIGLGFPNPTRQPTKGKGFEGHVVVYLEEGYLVDLSITQANRPRHKIYLKPFISKTSPNFLKEQGQSFQYPQEDGGDLILDYMLIENDEYKTALDWTSDRRKQISLMAVVALEEFFSNLKGK